MAYDISKLVKLGGLKALAQKISDLFVKKEAGKGLSTNDFDDTYKGKIDTLESTVGGIVTAGGEPNVITGVQKNGVDLPVTDKKVNVTVPTKTSDITNDSGFITNTAIAGKADKATTLAGYGIADAYTKSEIDGKMGGAFHYKASVPNYAALPTTGQTIGDVYNVQAASKPHGIKAGDNVAWDGSDWDVLSGVVDLSEYFTADEINAMIATDAEVTEMLNEVFA